MNVLLLMSMKNVRGMISFALESQFKLHVLEARTAEHAFQILSKLGKNIDLFVFEFIPEFRSVFAHLLEMESPPESMAVIPLEGATRMPSRLPERLVPIPADQLMDQLKLWAEKRKQDSGENQSPQSEEEFCRIRSDLLLRVVPLKAPVYIRLSESKFVKMFQPGDVYDRNDHEKYGQVKSIEYFYLKNDETAEFLSKFQKDLEKFLTLKGLSLEAVTDTSVAVHEMVSDMVAKVGATPAVQDMVKTSVALTMKTLGSSPKLKQVLDVIKRSPQSYVSAHSMQLGSLGCAIAGLMGWSSETTFAKINYAAFFHDIILKNQSLAAVESLDELKLRETEFSAEELKAFKEHPIIASELAKSFREIPADVDVMIAQHHELPDGSGFPRGLHSTRIHSLAAVMIVAHDMVHHIFHDEKDFRMEDFLSKTEKRYSSGVFKKIHQSLKELKI